MLDTVRAEISILPRSPSETAKLMSNDKNYFEKVDSCEEWNPYFKRWPHHQTKITKQMTDWFFHRRGDYKLWSDNMNGRYEDQRNGVSPRRRQDPDSNEEDKKRFEEAICELVNEVTFGLK